MTPASPAARAEQARSQRRAAAELTAVLRACPDLPPITWTIPPAGATLTGHVNGLAAAAVQHAFSSWRTALALRKHHPGTTPGQALYLHAAAVRNQVWVTLTATIFPDDDQPPS